MLTLEIDKSEDVAVLRCSGRIVRGDGADRLLRAAMSKQERNLLVDLSGVTVIDAAGLGVLAALERWARGTKRNLQLTNPSKPVRKALEVSHLSSVLQIVPEKANHRAA